MQENMTKGETTFRKFAEELRAAGFGVGEVHMIDPHTGQITYMSVTIDNPTAWRQAEAETIFRKLSAANVTLAIGSTLRRQLWDGVNNGAIKLHDFGFRGR